MNKTNRFRAAASSAARWVLVAGLLILGTPAQAEQLAPTPPVAPLEARPLPARANVEWPASTRAPAAGGLAADHGDPGFQQAKLTATDSQETLIHGYAVAASDTALAIGMSNRLGTRGKVVVAEELDGDWTAQVDVSTLTPSEGHYTPYFGQALAITGDGGTLVVGAQGQAGSQGSAYVFERPVSGWWDSELTETAMLSPSDGGPDDLFGQAVAIYTDTVVVGAPGGEIGAGAVYVYVKPEAGWAAGSGTETAKLTVGDGVAGDGFGSAVSISGSAVVVGAPGVDGARGAVYVFQRPAGGWADMTVIGPAKLTASDGAAGDGLGGSVDFDGATVVAGASGDDGATGSVYVFEQPETGWADSTHLAKLAASEGAPEDRLGHAVAISGENVVAGAYGRDGQRTRGFVFVKPETGWAGMSETATLLPRSSGTSRKFGWSIAIHESTVIVGELGTSSILLYGEPEGGWAGEQPHLRSLYTAGWTFGGQYGYSVSLSGDTAIVGAYGVEHERGTGAAYVHAEGAGGWSDMTETGTLMPSDAYIYEYGLSVAIDGDTAVTGSYYAFSGPQAPGAAYVFERPASGWTGVGTESAKLLASDGADFDIFGYSVAINGDTVVSSAPFHDLGENDGQGAVYLFQEPAGGWLSAGGTMTQTAKLVASDGAAQDYLGLEALAVHGDTVVAGAWRHADATGVVYVFVKPQGGWSGTLTETARLTASDGQPGDLLGYPVAIEGDTIVAGATRDDFNEVLHQGSAYVFEKPEGGWSDTNETVKLVASDGSEEDLLGGGLAISGNRIAVGATGADIGEAPDQGAVYVFERPAAGWAGARREYTKIIARDGAALDEFGYSISAFGDRLLVGAPSLRAEAGAAYIFEVPAPRQVWLPLAMH